MLRKLSWMPWRASQLKANDFGGDSVYHKCWLKGVVGDLLPIGLERK